MNETERRPIRELAVELKRALDIATWREEQGEALWGEALALAFEVKNFLGGLVAELPAFTGATPRERAAQLFGWASEAARVEPTWGSKTSLPGLAERLERLHGLTARLEGRPRMKGEWIGQALMLLKKHPNATNRRIAKECGVSPSQLSRGRFRAWAKAVRASKDDVRKGFRDARSGNVEATDV